ncbi:MAG: carbon storage regulator CsrA [Chloroflexi bacterium]|nr:carbon storage regulator CsrA [Chloroflexota bacterium]MBV9131177.1 carbon storage regulator CsrA [Chloroflexota bacterium]MBV9896619.1 carbon storage regulator CsrA [Chloroflexota bacterium]
MLILSRRPEQSVHLGDHIKITVLGVEGDRVKLGIQAPAEIVVLRNELFQQVQSANSAAATTVRPSPTAIAALLRGKHPADSKSGAPVL